MTTNSTGNTDTAIDVISRLSAENSDLRAALEERQRTINNLWITLNHADTFSHGECPCCDGQWRAHLGVGYIVADIASEGNRAILAREPGALLPPPIFWSALAGAYKESIDSMDGGRWDWRDFGCTALGGGLHFTVHF
jgi:hypothetical protein